MKTEDFDRYRVRPSTNVSLKKADPAETGAFSGGKDEAAGVLGELNKKLGGLQELLYAERRHKVLIVLQGMDTAGKDGVIRRVFEGVNPQGVKVSGFKAPTAEELAHDYLWRVHRCVPGQGEIAIFNRSHYEDVLVVRVHDLVPKEVWKTRYESINAFEKTLHQEGTAILKFFLHISKEEQLHRFKQRLDDPKRQWKISEADYAERKFWSEYQEAYEDALSQTSTKHAPWFVIPANHKWFRNLAVSRITVETLESLKMKFPEPAVNIKDIKRKYHAAEKEEDRTR